MKTSLSKIAQLVEGDIIGSSSLMIRGAAPFDMADENQITVAGVAKYLKALDATAAGAILVPRNIQTAKQPLVQVDNPMVAFAKVMHYFHPPQKPEAGIHPSASIGHEVQIGHEVCIGPMAVIGNRVIVGDRIWLQPGVVIGDHVEIGNDVTLYPNVTVAAGCKIGNRVVIHSGTVIGSDGFGYAPDGKSYHKIPHIGFVQIDDDAEIGANNTIDRGTFGKTWLRRGVKTDNLVHIAHNVTVGENTVLVAQVGISGSVSIGKNAILAGQAGIAGHLTIGDGATIGPQTGVGKPVPDGQIVMSGLPEMPQRLWLRVQRLIPKLPEFSKRLSRLEKQLQALEEIKD